MKHLLLLFLCFTLGTYAQEESGIDSLKQMAFGEAPDSTRVNSYLALIRHFKRNNEDSCRAYLEKLKNYGEGKNSNRALFHHYRQKAGYFGLYIKKDESAETFIYANLEEALNYAKQSEDPTLLAMAYTKLSVEKSRFGATEEALDYANQCLVISIENNLWEETAYMYSMMGEAYLYSYKMMERALQYTLKSDSIYMLMDPDHEERGFALSAIGTIYKDLGNVEEAEEYNKRALDLYKRTGNVYQQMSALASLASIERIKKNYPLAVEYIQQSIKYYSENKYLVKEAMYHIGLSEIYFEAGQMEDALWASTRAIDLNRRNEDSFGIMLSLIMKAEILNEIGRYSESYELALEANGLANEMDSYIDKEESLKLLYLASEEMGNYKQAYEFSKEHKRVNDSLTAWANIDNAKELEARYKRTQQEQEIEMLETQNELSGAKQRNQRNLFFGLGGVGALGLIVLFVLYRNRRKTLDKMVELDAAKTTFFENISHEFRTPLSLISGPLEKRLDNSSIDETDRKEFEMMQRNSNRLMGLIEQLLDISKLESKHYKLNVTEGDLTGLLKSLSASFVYAAQEKRLNYRVKVDEFEKGWFDRDAIEKIVVNLLSNAVKYSPEGGEVNFECLRQNGNLQLTIENSGKTFSEKEVDTIFERFSRRNSDEQGASHGSGVGLALVKELIVLSHGRIKAENSSDSSVKFTAVIPINKEAYAPGQLSVTVKEDHIIDRNEVDTHHLETSDIPVLLVVDDNDDIRSFVKDMFSKEYKVLEAADGEAGIISAIENIPDIIISDIMMPNINGVELCGKLKQDERTSHIPIILLTAKADDSSEFEGLETGADDYVLKPFSTRMLSTRVKNLVKSRAKLRQRYSKEVVLKPADISINDADARFIVRLKKVLDEKITEESFSVEEFSKDLHMSRMQLHRKLKALTGLSASEFLRTERLKLAYELLQNKELNINEVCYKVGFNNPSYFSKCFKEAFGILPTEYRDRL
ncbi:response regulator [Aureitalea sp. L0-47]|uniref:hybrid sensor histidine kinase/response regulator transcription factor n=1 Tax=Aureitalea sp. L0-47 TaxID=2816962 RepID=UPI0022370184|nr:response regulator [Aureitalea sp. L0-47]MCW5518532.1 response regulator [Aureitalea sp. L0-47]